MVSGYFKLLDQKIEASRQEVLKKVNDSHSFKDIELMLIEQKSNMGFDKEEKFEKAKQELDKCVQKGCYASVVGKKEEYNTLTQ